MCANFRATMRQKVTSENDAKAKVIPSENITCHIRIQVRIQVISRIQYRHRSGIYEPSGAKVARVRCGRRQRGSNGVEVVIEMVMTVAVAVDPEMCRRGRDWARGRLELGVFGLQIRECLTKDVIAGARFTEHLLQILYALVFALAVGAL